MINLFADGDGDGRFNEDCMAMPPSKYMHYNELWCDGYRDFNVYMAYACT
jgi:hypothetical protein